MGEKRAGDDLAPIAGDPVFERWREICACTVREREGRGDVFAPGVVDEAAKRAMWQYSTEAAVQVVSEALGEYRVDGHADAR